MNIILIQLLLLRGNKKSGDKRFIYDTIHMASTHYFIMSYMIANLVGNQLT